MKVNGAGRANVTQSNGTVTCSSFTQRRSKGNNTKHNNEAKQSKTQTHSKERRCKAMQRKTRHSSDDTNTCANFLPACLLPCLLACYCMLTGLLLDCWLVRAGKFFACATARESNAQEITAERRNAKHCKASKAMQNDLVFCLS